MLNFFKRNATCDHVIECNCEEDMSYLKNRYLNIINHFIHCLWSSDLDVKFYGDKVCLSSTMATFLFPKKYYKTMFTIKEMPMESTPERWSRCDLSKSVRESMTFDTPYVGRPEPEEPLLCINNNTGHEEPYYYRVFVSDNCKIMLSEYYTTLASEISPNLLALGVKDGHGPLLFKDTSIDAELMINGGEVER